MDYLQVNIYFIYLEFAKNLFYTFGAMLAIEHAKKLWQKILFASLSSAACIAYLKYAKNLISFLNSKKY